jgi:peptide/nickel transport system substrate-binding protein
MKLVIEEVKHMKEGRKLTRREFIRLSTLATAGVIITACQTPVPTEEPVVETTAAPIKEATVQPKVEITKLAPGAEEPIVATLAPEAKYKEAPMLADLVAKGELPPVEERLPLNPYVEVTRESIGKYGGNLRRGFNGASDRWGPTKFNDRSLVWLDENLNLIPRILESWEVSPDAKVYTFKLRKGMKWSDGTDFTSADWKWYFENMVKNTELNTGIPTRYSTVGADKVRVLCEMEFPDDYTVVYKFAHPNTLFMYGALRAAYDHFAPKYMEQFHAGFVSKTDIDAKVSNAGLGAWTELFTNMNYWYNNPERPQIFPWLGENTLVDEVHIMKRNPYFFGIDAEGNQLPYINRITHRLFENADMFNLWIINGEIDFQNRHVALSNFTLFKENEAAGDYQVFVGSSAGHTALQLNLATKEPKLNEFFNTRDVRIAISLAMNREEVNELIYNGMTTPRQYSPLKLSPNYYEKLSNAYIEYDPDRANQMLDDAGYVRGADGYRMFKDGSGPISFTIEGTAASGTTGEDEALLMVKYLDEVGIKSAYKYYERALYTEHYEANEIEAATWGGDRTVLPLAPSAIIFRGVGIDRPWAAGFGQWFNSSGQHAAAVEPPEGHFIWKIWDLWEQIQAEPDPAQQNKLFEGILDIWAEELPMIGLLGEAPALVIVKNGFRNYLPGQPIDDTTGDEHLLQTETYFWEEPEKHLL